MQYNMKHGRGDPIAIHRGSSTSILVSTFAIPENKTDRRKSISPRQTISGILGRGKRPKNKIKIMIIIITLNYKFIQSNNVQDQPRYPSFETSGSFLLVAGYGRGWINIGDAALTSDSGFE